MCVCVCYVWDTPLCFPTIKRGIALRSDLRRTDGILSVLGTQTVIFALCLFSSTSAEVRPANKATQKHERDARHARGHDCCAHLGPGYRRNPRQRRGGSLPGLLRRVNGRCGRVVRRLRGCVNGRRCSNTGDPFPRCFDRCGGSIQSRSAYPVRRGYSRRYYSLDLGGGTGGRPLHIRGGGGGGGSRPRCRNLDGVRGGHLLGLGFLDGLDGRFC